MEQDTNTVSDETTPVIPDLVETREDTHSETNTILESSPSPLVDTALEKAFLKKPWYQKHILSAKIVALVGIALFFSSFVFLVHTEKTQTPVKQFTNVYSFVPEKVSKSAMIPIHLPEGVREIEAQGGISFNPELAGTWVTDTEEGTIFFDPSEALREGVYYAVNMDTGAVQMSGDFYVAPDPQVESVFPKEGSEANESTEITIMFNRPMVPLTTLSEMEDIALPITINPPTEGKFKWISTRNVQFIPATTLVPSSEYQVVIGKGLVSLDGLPVAPYTHTFTTRLIRYTVFPEGALGYTSPMIIGFNQPVDLDAAKKRISVQNGNEADVQLILEYGETSHYDRVTGKMVTKEDTRKIFVYPKKDAHGRARVWDFNTAYTLTVKGAVPLSGSITLEEERSVRLTVPQILQNIEATSERTSLVMPELFDPKGSLVLTFYDDIDKDRSRIETKGLRSVVYGERCNEDENGETIMLGNSCEKVADTRTLILSFDESKFGVGESFSLTLDRIVTQDGFRLNAEPITIPMRIYPQFTLLSTTPSNGEGAGALDQMIICSNVPLQNPLEEGVSAYVSTDGYIVYGNWSDSQYVSSEYYSSYTCKSEEFETHLSYGLLPNTSYTLALSLKDSFGQSAQKAISFTTKSPEETYTRFHNMQQQYNVTRPERTKFTYAVENLEFVDLHMCRLTPEAFLRRTEAGESAQSAPRADDCIEVIQDRIELPSRYWVNNYFQVDLHDHFADTRGHYVLTFSSPLYRSSESRYNIVTRSYDYVPVQLYDRTYVSVTNLAVGKKEVEFFENNYEYEWGSQSGAAKRVLNASLAQNQNLYWVNYSNSLSPVLGAVVTQFESNPEGGTLTQRSTGVTNGEGIARVTIEKNIGGAVVRSGADTAVVSDWVDRLSYATPAHNASRTYIYTDRPIYRPGHMVHIRGLDRIGFDGAYEVWQKENVPIIIFDSKGTQIYDTTLTVSTYGTFNTQFELPKDAPLGTYRIEVFGQNAWFDVEEYVPAAFKLETSTDKVEYINGDTITVDVQADYYFGVPVSEGTVSYAITAQDYYFDRYTDSYFNFGGSWYSCYGCGYGDSFMFRGEARINESGHARIERAINLQDYFKDDASVKSKLITVSVTAKDINGRAVSAQKSFIMHAGDFYIGAITDEYYTGVHTPVTLRVKTVDTQGVPVAVSAITRTVHKVEWETFKRQEVDGGFYYRSEKRLTEISKEQIKTDDEGNWKGALTFSDEGQYEVNVEKTDNRGHVIETTVYVYIYGTDAVSVPPNNNYELELEVEQANVQVGDTASVLIKSPYPNAKVLITAERGTLYDYWVKDITGGLALHEFEVKSAYSPNVFVSALLLSNDPEVKYGSVRFDVDRDQHVLDVEVSSDKEHYLPGEKVTLTVVTKDVNGARIPAEVSLAVADLSVLALKGNQKKDPLMFFYDGFPLSVSTASNIKNILHEVDIPLGTKGGGGNPDDLATKKRGLFKDTAFWNASVTTDAEGNATVSFTLPDNLTTWQIESVGITRDTKVGVDYDEFTTKKDLMAVPLAPRFIVPGDTFMLGAKVFNQTDAGATIDVKLESDTLVFTGSAEDEVHIGSGETKTVYFRVEAPSQTRDGSHTFTFTASYGSFVDSVEQSISVTANTTYETVATANMSRDAVSTEYIYIPKNVVQGEGGLTINANATLAVFMTDALMYMAAYPYGCSEQLASALSTIGTLTKALALPNVQGSFETIEYNGMTYRVEDAVEEGLTKIYEAQVSNGGFVYYKGLQPNLGLSVHVLTALSDLRDAGFVVREEVLTQTVLYIVREVQNPSTRELYDRETIIWAEYALRKANGNTDTALTDMVRTYTHDAAFLNETLSSMSLAYLAIITAEGFSGSDRKRVYDALLNRIDIDGRGAYLKMLGAPTWLFYETSIKNTALLLKAFVAHKDENVEIGNVLKWLLSGRDGNGVWGSTHNTFVVVDAMVEYLEWQHETKAVFTLDGFLDGVSVFTHTFSPKNVFETFTHVMPIDTFAREKLLPLTLTRTDTNERKNTLYYDMSLKYFLPVASLPPRDEGITITRDLYALADTALAEPLTQTKVGDIVRGKITIMTPSVYQQVAIEDYIPAGFEIVNFNLDTEAGVLETEEGNYGLVAPSVREKDGLMAQTFGRVMSLFNNSQTAQLYNAWMYEDEAYESTQSLWPSHQELHDDRMFLYIDTLEPGVYEYEYYLRALVPGTFQHLPARAGELYFPEVFGRTSGAVITVTAD